MKVFKTRSEALASINERKRTTRGVEYPLFEVYLGVNLLTKKPERLYASSRKRLVEAINDFYRARNEAGDFITMLTPSQIMDAKEALRALSEAKMDISLSECAKREIGRSKRVIQYSMKLGEAFDKFMAYHKLNSPGELKKKRSTVGKWISMVGEDRIASEVTIGDVSEYLHTEYDAKEPGTYNSHLNYINTFLSWCASEEQGIIPANPSVTMKEKPVAWKKPKYLKVEFVRQLFDLLYQNRVEHPDFLALAVTQFFICVRREEALRMAKDPDTATIIIEDETFRMDGGKGYTRGKAPRSAHLPENAVAWIKCFDYASAMETVKESTTKRYYSFARKNGIPMFKNCARHTFITMHVAKFHTPDVTQAMVGTSAKMRADHYDGLASQREGEEYFSILPPTRTSA